LLVLACPFAATPPGGEPFFADIRRGIEITERWGEELIESQLVTALDREQPGQFGYNSSSSLGCSSLVSVRLSRPMETKAILISDSLTSKISFQDGYIRAVCCSTITVPGFWCPLMVLDYSGPDPQLGIDTVLSLPLIVVFAYRATCSLCCAYGDAPNIGRKELPINAALLPMYCYL
jgi:hypothetical protein